MLNKKRPLNLAFQALADPTRRSMLVRLARGPATVSELARPLSISLPAVMQHLTVLEDSGLVRSEKSGRVRTCQIEPSALGQVERWLHERRLEWESRFDQFANYLGSMNNGGPTDGEEK